MLIVGRLDYTDEGSLPNAQTNYNTRNRTPDHPGINDGTPLSERQRWLQWTVLGYERFALLEQPHYGERAVVAKATSEIIGAVGFVPYFQAICVALCCPVKVALSRPTHQRVTQTVGRAG
jgi:hypothetical protein